MNSELHELLADNQAAPQTISAAEADLTAQASSIALGHPSPESEGDKTLRLAGRRSGRLICLQGIKCVTLEQCWMERAKDLRSAHPVEDGEAAGQGNKGAGL